MKQLAKLAPPKVAQFIKISAAKSDAAVEQSADEQPGRAA
jgi:hypothetical protein